MQTSKQALKKARKENVIIVWLISVSSDFK